MTFQLNSLPSVTKDEIRNGQKLMKAIASANLPFVLTENTDFFWIFAISFGPTYVILHRHNISNTLLRVFVRTSGYSGTSRSCAMFS